MKDDNYFKEQRKKEDKLNLGELPEIVEDLEATSITLFFEDKKPTSLNVIMKGGINSHMMYKIQKLYNLDLITVSPVDEERVEVNLRYIGL
jgi:hypothetical protein